MPRAELVSSLIIGAIIAKPVRDVTQLKPVVEKAVKALYGQAVQNVKVPKADRFPLFKEPRQGRLVHAEFNDDKHEYAVGAIKTKSQNGMFHISSFIYWVAMAWPASHRNVDLRAQ